MLILKENGLTLKYKYSIKCKNTARCPEQYVASDENNTLYLVVYAKTETQIFYALRAVRMQEHFIKIVDKKIKTNAPVFSGFLGDGYYVVYHFFHSYKQANNEIPQKIILEFYEKHAIEVKVDGNVIRKIEDDFLNAFPLRYHSSIKKLNAFKRFDNELKKHDRLKISFQHGDFTPNNILDVMGKGLIVMDFEFSMAFQPIGFDLFDYHYATDKKYSMVPYLEINSIKEEIQNQANELIDGNCRPSLIKYDSSFYKDIFHHWSDDLIYNRPDLYEQNCYTLHVAFEEHVFEIHYYILGIKAILCVWLKPLPAQVVEYLIKYIFLHHKTVVKIELNYSSINYNNLLSPENNWVVFLPKKTEDVFNRLGKKSRYNLRREMRLLEEQCGKISLTQYKSFDIPQNVFEIYFAWKRLSHGVDYKISGGQYCKKYHVTDGMTLSAGDKIVAILFYCVLNRTVYLENISYDVKYSKCSPGIILYEKFLEQMVEDQKETVFLGNGNQTYKTRFGSVEYLVYSGSIFRNSLFKYLNLFKTFKWSKIKAI